MENRKKNVYLYITELLSCTAEINSVINQLYFSKIRQMYHMAMKFQIIVTQSQQPDINTLHVFSWQFRRHFMISWCLSSWLWILFFSLPCYMQRKEKESESHSVTLCDPMGSTVPGMGIFPTQGSNPGLPHGRCILYQLSHQGNLRILEWVAYPFFRGSSWPRDRTGVSCITGRFFTSWAIREAPRYREEPANLKFILIGLVNCIGTDH